MSTVRLKNVRITGFGTVFRMSVHDHVIADNLSISGSNVAFDVSDGPLQGVVMDLHWVDLLAACFALVRMSHGASGDERRVAFRSSELGRMLASSHDVDRLLDQLLVAEGQGFSLEHLMSSAMRQWLRRGIQ